MWGEHFLYVFRIRDLQLVGHWASAEVFVVHQDASHVYQIRLSKTGHVLPAPPIGAIVVAQARGERT